MSNYLEKIIYLTKNQYQTLITNNQVNNNYLYITDDDGISLDDLNQTIINVAHGGTGVNTITSGYVLVGNGTNPITTIQKTNTNVANTLVERDANGDFSARTITAALSGNATSATKSKYVELYEARGTTTTLNKAANYIAAGAMFHLVASSSTSATDNGKTPMGDANILQMNWDNSGGYDAQLAISTSKNRMEFRDQISMKKAWREVVTSTPEVATGSASQPVYISTTGIATAISYTIEKSVPSDAVFTDTNKYHKTGSWGGTNNLTYTADTVNNADALTFTLATASTSVYGVTKLYDGVNSSSTELAATAKAVKTAYDKAVNIIAESNALVYKGTRNGNSSSSDGGAYTPAADCGDVYIVSNPGYINGIYVELGDMIICNTDDTVAATSSNYPSIAGKWDIIQTSNGTVSTSETNVTDGHIPLFSGITGRFIKNSSKSLTATAPTSSSDDTTIPTSKAVWTTVNTAINSLDVNAVGGNTGEYISQISEANGKISATVSTTSVSNIWNAGTTAGPTLQTTVNGITGTAVTIPSASSTASGIVTTGEQTFSGEKTFSSSTHFKNIYHYNGNSIEDGSWITGANGTAPTVSGSSYTGSVIGTSILTLGNNIIGGNSEYGANNNAQGFLRLYSSGSTYAQITAYAGDKTRLYPEEGISIPTDKVGIMFRPTSGSYYTHFSYQTGNNEALVMATKNAVTSFIFINGESQANVSSTRWRSLTPALQIKNNSVIIGKLIDTDVTPGYKLEVNGTSYFNDLTTHNGNIVPFSDNTKTLGATNAKWSKLYIGSANSYGDAYQPVYWNDGVPTVSYPVQYSTWSIDEGDNTAELTTNINSSTPETKSPAPFTTDTYVVALVVRSGEQYLNGPITWESTANTLTLRTATTSGVVSGYVLTATGIPSKAQCQSKSVTT